MPGILNSPAFYVAIQAVLSLYASIGTIHWNSAENDRWHYESSRWIMDFVLSFWTFKKSLADFETWGFPPKRCSALVFFEHCNSRKSSQHFSPTLHPCCWHTLCNLWFHFSSTPHPSSRLPIILHETPSDCANLLRPINCRVKHWNQREMAHSIEKQKLLVAALTSDILNLGGGKDVVSVIEDSYVVTDSQRWGQSRLRKKEGAKGRGRQRQRGKSTERRQCPFFGSRIGCKYGDNCNNLHSDPNSINWCRVTQSGKQCKKEDCRFRHYVYCQNDSGSWIIDFATTRLWCIHSVLSTPYTSWFCGLSVM